jgi:hypothetical protein
MAGLFGFPVIVAIEIAESKAGCRLAAMAVPKTDQLSRPLIFISRFRAIWAVKLDARDRAALTAKP